MPVHASVVGGILEVVIDGDYTSAEVRRVGSAALDGAAGPMPVFMDFSGAAGMGRRDPADLRETTTFLAARKAQFSRVAILAPSDAAYGLMRMASAFAGGEGLHVEVVRTRAEAMEWLEESEPERGTPYNDDEERS